MSDAKDARGTERPIIGIRDAVAIVAMVMIWYVFKAVSTVIQNMPESSKREAGQQLRRFRLWIEVIR